MRYVVKDLGALEHAYILPLGDIHIGAPEYNEKKFLKFRDWVAQTPNTFVVLPGDILNCATKTSKSDTYSETMPVQEAKKYAVKVLEPIKGKILGIVRGNHEARVWRESGDDPAEDIAMALGVDYNPHGLYLNLKVGQYHKTRDSRINYLFYMTHGHGGGSTKGAKTNVLAKTSNIVDADCYVVGHIHFMNTFKDKYLRPDVKHSRMEFVTRTYVSAGSFLDWGGYSEDMMLPPSKLGAPRIRLDGGRKDLHVSI